MVLAIPTQSKLRAVGVDLSEQLGSDTNLRTFQSLSSQHHSTKIICGNAHRYKKCLKNPQPSQAPKHGKRMFLPSCPLLQLMQLPGIHTYFGRGYQCRKFRDSAWSSLALEYGEYEELVKLPMLLSPFCCSLCWWQNHRIIQARRDSGIMQGNPCTKQHQLKEVVLSLIHSYGVLMLLRMETTSSVGSWSCVLTSLPVKKKKKNQISNPNFLHTSLYPLLFLLFLCTSQKSPIQILISPTFRQCSRSKKSKDPYLDSSADFRAPKELMQ